MVGGLQAGIQVSGPGGVGKMPGQSHDDMVCSQDVLALPAGEWVLVPSGELGALSALH